MNYNMLHVNLIILSVLRGQNFALLRLNFLNESAVYIITQNPKISSIKKAVFLL